MQDHFGLVLSSGGAKGAYAGGVLKALYACGLHQKIKVISGTSVGALNMGLFLQNDPKLIESLWLNLHPGSIFRIHPAHLIQKTKRILSSLGLPASFYPFLLHMLMEGVFSPSGLSLLIDKHLDLGLIKHSPIKSFATCCRLSDLMPVDFELNQQDEDKIKSILLASSALPFIFPAQWIAGEKYVDGGLPAPIGKNTPLDKVLAEGCNVIFTVYLEPKSEVIESASPDRTFVHLAPSFGLGGLKGVFDFDNKSIQKKFQMGYEETMRTLSLLKYKFM